MANGTVTATDVSNNPNYPMVEGFDHILDTPNSGGGTSYLFSTAQSNAFSLIGEGKTLWVDCTTPMGYMHFLTGMVINGENGYGIKLRPFNGPMIFDPSVVDNPHALHLNGDIHHFEIYGYEEHAGYIGARNGWKDYTGRNMGIQFLNLGTSNNRVDTKIDGIGHTWIRVNGTYHKGFGLPYSGISFHKAGDDTLYENFSIINCQFSNKRGEALYGNSNKEEVIQHGINGLWVENNLFENGHYELIQIQQAEGNVVWKNNVFKVGSLAWQNPFQPDQDGNGQIQHTRTGNFIVEDCIFLGAAQYALIVGFFNTWPSPTGTVIFRRCIIGCSRNYLIHLGSGNMAIEFEDCYFMGVGGDNFSYDKVYNLESAKTYVANLNSPLSVAFTRCTYPVGMSLYTGSATSGVTETDNVEVDSPLPIFKNCPIQTKKPGYKYQELEEWMFEIMLDTAQGSNAGKRTGEPVIQEAGQLRLHEGKLYEVITTHTASTAPEVHIGYATIAAMLADQGSQVSTNWYRVDDATSDPAMGSGKCYYQYDGVANGLLADYTSVYGGSYADISALLADQGSQSTGIRYRVVNTAADPNFSNSTTRSYIYNGTPTADVDDYDVKNEGLATGEYTLELRPDQDVGADPVPDGNQETVGTYYKLLWFYDEENDEYTSDIPANYVLEDDSPYQGIGLLTIVNSVVRRITPRSKKVSTLL